MIYNELLIRIFAVSIVLGSVGSNTMLRAQPAGTFTVTGNMTAVRPFPAATLLTNGKVLIVGNRFPSADSAAELYDPVAGTFRATGATTPWSCPPNEGSPGQWAALLPDGRVLIAGGCTNTGEPSTRAELYDPVTEQFSPTGPMITPRVNPHAILLANGKVLIVGGDTPNPPYPTDIPAELYDPLAGIFTPTGPFIGAGPNVISATALSDGRVLVVGSWTGQAAIYDPGNGIFTATGTPGAFHGSAVLLASGKVLLTGGINDWGWDSSAELYDPTSGTFAWTGSMTRQRIGQSATLLSDGTVLIAGGDSDPSTGTAEFYDPSTGTFSAAGNMVEPRLDHAAPVLPDGSMLIAGGGRIFPVTDSLAQIYHPAAARSSPALFSLSGDGHGQGATWNAVTGQVASSMNPAHGGDVLAMYTASLIESGVIPPQVAVAGRPAEVLYFGDAPGYPGYFQINFRLPNGLAAGEAVPVRLTYLGRPSNQVTIAVQ